MKKFIPILLFLSMFILSGCNMMAKDAIIEVNGNAITQKNYDNLYNKYNPKTHNQKDNKGLELILRHNVVSELIVRELINQEVRAHKIKVKSDELNSAIQEAYAQAGGKDAFEKFIKNVYGITPNEFQNNLEQEIKISKLIDKVSPMISTSDSETNNFYEKNKETIFNHPKMVRASHILIMANEEDFKNQIKSQNKNLSETEVEKLAKQKMNQAKTKAQGLLQEALNNPNNFDKLAKENSQDIQSAKNGGDLNFFSYDEMIKSFSQAAFATKPSNIYPDIVQTDYGYHIIKVTDRKEAGMVPFDEVKEEIKKKITQDKKNKAFQTYISSKKDKATIKYKNPKYDPINIEKELKELTKSFAQNSTTKNPIVKESAKNE